MYHIKRKIERQKTTWSSHLTQRKHLTKTQHISMVKTLRNLEVEGDLLNLIKSICENPTTDIIFSCEKWKASPLILNIALEVLTTVFRQRQDIKGIQMVKWEVNLSLFTDNMILCIANPRESKRKLLESIIKFRKVAKYKMNTGKSFVSIHQQWTIWRAN